MVVVYFFKSSFYHLLEGNHFWTLIDWPPKEKIGECVGVFDLGYWYTGAEEQFLLRGAQVNKKNEILTNFQNLT